MVNGIVVAVNGIVGDVTMPIKTTDVLDWIRKKYKKYWNSISRENSRSYQRIQMVEYICMYIRR